MTYRKPPAARKSESAGLRRLREYERLFEAWCAANPKAPYEEVVRAKDEITKQLCG